jgi:hypothetical protein
MRVADSLSIGELSIMQEFFALISRPLSLILLPQQLNKPKSKRMMALFSTLNPNRIQPKRRTKKDKLITKARKDENTKRKLNKVRAFQFSGFRG